MLKMLKCAGNDDSITLSAQDSVDKVTFVFESPSALPPSPTTAIQQQPRKCSIY